MSRFCIFCTVLLLAGINRGIYASETTNYLNELKELTHSISEQVSDENFLAKIHRVHDILLMSNPAYPKSIDATDIERQWSAYRSTAPLLYQISNRADPQIESKTILCLVALHEVWGNKVASILGKELPTKESIISDNKDLFSKYSPFGGTPSPEDIEFTNESDRAIYTKLHKELLHFDRLHQIQKTLARHEPDRIKITENAFRFLSKREDIAHQAALANFLLSTIHNQMARKKLWQLALEYRDNTLDPWETYEP